MPGDFWGKNLDALQDILSGGFNIPESPFKLIWRGIDHSKKMLGYEATTEWYREKVNSDIDDPETLEYLNKAMRDAENGKGETLFHMLYDVLQSNSDKVETVKNELIFYM